jgi:hypothetical protein
MMTRKFFRLAAIFPFALALFIGSTALASGETKFTGVVEALPDTPGFIGDWRVAGRTVHVSNRTEIEQEDGRVRLGAKVKVEGFLRSDGSIDATEVEVKDGSGDDGHGGDDDGDRDDSDLPQFKGTIQSLPGTPGQIGDWRVGGRVIHVFASTRIETEFGPVAVGAFVEIRGVLRADGSMDAVKIEVESGDDDGRDELKGAIESLPAGPGFQGDWRVAGRIVHVTAATVLDQEHGTFVIGALVEVHGLMRADGSIDTGIDRNHPDIRDHLWTNPAEVADDNIDNDSDGLIDDTKGWNFVDNNNDTMEARGQPQTSIAGHGTFIAGLIGLIAPEARIDLISIYPEINGAPDYAVWSGTSFAAPLASAGAALILEGDSNRNARAALEDTATVIDGSNPQFAGRLGRGRINALLALQSLDPTVTADGGGSFELELSTEDGSLPAQLRPVSNIRLVKVLDSLGREVLSGGPPT